MDLENSQEMSKVDIQTAGNERVKLIGKFFSYHAVDEIYVRRLVLTLPPASSTSGKRQRSDSSSTQSRKPEVINICGASFGSTLGSICAYLEGRGVPGERAYVLRSIRYQLLPIAESLGTMRGADVSHLSRGLASCRVVNAQRPYLVEAMVRIDSKYGNAHTCIGATATLLCCFGTMAAVPNHARHFVADNSLIKALRCSYEALTFWKVSSMHMAANNWESLAAEKRALKRAVAGALEAAREAEKCSLDPTPSILLQLRWAREAAFPSGALVSEFNQARLLRQIKAHELFEHVKRRDTMGPPDAVKLTNVDLDTLVTTSTLVDIVPLSQISEAALNPNQRKKRKSADDTQSVGSSSWATMSSNGSSFSHVSADSMGEIVEPFVHTHV